MATWVVDGGGGGDFLTIQAAIDAVGTLDGDTIQINAGTYNENVVVTKELNLVGAGATTIIEGTFLTDNSVVGDLDVWIQTAVAYSGASGAGVTVSADNVTIQDLTITSFRNGIFLNDTDNLLLQNVDITQTVIGIYSDAPAAANITNFEMDGGSITHSAEGFTIEQNQATPGEFTNAEIHNTDFSDLTWKGIYLEEIQDSSIHDITMDNVGQFGRPPTFGPVGTNGSGIELNVKFEDYSNVDIYNFTMTDVGLSNGSGSPHAGAGAIYIKPRDFGSPYGADPATLDNVTIHDGSIDNTSTGIRFGEAGQVNAGPTGSSVYNVDVTNSALGDFDNRTSVQMDVTLTSGDDVATVNPASTGSFHFDGDDGNDQITSGGVGGGVGDTIDGGNGNDTLSGAGGNDTLNGEADNDTLNGDAGDDALNGGAGNDLLVGGAGADALDGGLNIDTADYSASASGVNVFTDGTAGTGGDAAGDTLANVEIVAGSAFDDTMTGGAANDTFQGGTGNDTLMGGAGEDDRLTGGAGADTLDGGAGSNDHALYDGSPAGVVVDLNLAVQVSPGSDADGDVLIGIESVHGATGFSNTITGTDGEGEHLKGGTVADTLTGNGGDDWLDAEGGNDSLFGGAGNDTLEGEGGDDLIDDGGGADTVSGGAGNDSLVAGDGADIVDGGADIDRLDYSNSTAGVTVDLDAGTGVGGYAAGDTIANVEVVIGSGFADTLTGDAGDNTLDGGAGNDVLNGGDGNDLFLGGAGADDFNGGAGSDTVDFSGQPGVSVNLATGTTSDGDTLNSIENITGATFTGPVEGSGGDNTITGGGGDDTFDGNQGNDVLDGGAGDDSLTGGTGNDVVDGGDDDDTIFGNQGNDTLTGGAGNDTMFGGAGSDVFDFNMGDGHDRIMDFGKTDFLDIGDFGFADFAAFQGGVTLSTFNNIGFTIDFGGGDILDVTGKTLTQFVGNAGSDIIF